MSSGTSQGVALALAVDLTGAFLCVKAVLPEMVDELDPELKERVLNTSPLGRLIRPAEVAQVVAFLADDRAGAVSGECVRVGGA